MNVINHRYIYCIYSAREINHLQIQKLLKQVGKYGHASSKLNWKFIFAIDVAAVHSHSKYNF